MRLDIVEDNDELFVVAENGYGINALWVRLLIRLYELDEEVFEELMDKARELVIALDNGGLEA